MDTKKTIFLPLLLMAILALPAVTTIQAPQSILASSSSGDGGDSEEETTNSEDSSSSNSNSDAPLGEETTTPTPTPASIPGSECGNDGELVNGQCVPFGCTSAANPPPSCPPLDDTSALLQQAPGSTTFPNGSVPTVDSLIQKYGANRTLPAALMHEGTNNTKAVVLTFDDNWLSQYDYAEPILKDNGFNATFYIYCLGIEQGPAFMTGAQLRDLHAKGYDIQSHSMTHADLTSVDENTLNFEIAESKNCLQDLVPGANVTGFATPFASGGDNATILQKIADSGFDYGRAGYGASFDLACAGYYVPQNQTAGCEMFGTGANASVLKVQSRWNIPVEDMNTLGEDNGYDLNRTQTAFIRELNDSLTFDGDGNIKAIPILVYHNFSNRVLPADEMGQSLLAESFAQEMQYLKANGYNVLSMADLVFDPTTQTFSIPKLGSQ
jgi:peptidoglycan/xylan/chitin deacetylase (PgdA/CDA1 family)